MTKKQGESPRGFPAVAMPTAPQVRFQRSNPCLNPALILAGLCLLLAVAACGPVETAALPSALSPTPSSVALRPSPLPSPPPSAVPPTPIPTPPLPTAVPPLATHVVQPGDTLLGLALAYDVPIAAIQLQNGMGESTTLYVGEVLAIPPASDWQRVSPFWIVHVVKEGETLTGIARAYGLSVEALQEVNALPDAGRLQVGGLLVIPLEAPVAPRPPAASPTPAPTLPPSTAPAEPLPTLTLAPVAPPPAIADWPRELARLIDEVRARHGLPPFAYNDTLALAAQAHADDCAQRGWCSHVGSDGSNVKARILRAGYHPTGWAECWAWVQSPQHAVDIWMDEVPPDDPHRRTLLSTWLTEIGIGVVEADWGYYFIADFGRP